MRISFNIRNCAANGRRLAGTGRFARLFSCLLTGSIYMNLFFTPAMASAASNHFTATIEKMSSFGDRSTGSRGNQAAAEYIQEEFSRIGLEKAGVHLFSVPVLEHKKSRLILHKRGAEVPIQPIYGNVISPGTIPAPGLSGPLIYAGPGDLKDFNQKEIAGAVILMELDSGKNWLHAANLGAKALIYVDRGVTSRIFFEDKIELSPIHFPRFILSELKVRELFGTFETAPKGLVEENIGLVSETRWQVVSGRNIYGLVPGVDPDLKEQLVLVEAFYDTTAMVFGHSPGADAAVGIATLLELARKLKEHPPGRSVLLVASGGHAQTLAGMRELIWSIKAKKSDLKKTEKQLKAIVAKTQKTLEAFEGLSFQKPAGQTPADVLADQDTREALVDRIKTEVDIISRRLMRLRLDRAPQSEDRQVKALAGKRFLFRRLSWRSQFKNLSEEEQQALTGLIPAARKDQKAMLSDAKNQLSQLKSAAQFRSAVNKMKLATVISLHLSSHGNGLGAFNEGWLYSLKPQINRVSAYSTLDQVLRNSASAVEQATGLPPMFKDTLRPSGLRSWQSYLPDRPALGGEVSALAGYLGVSLATVNDARILWGTPHDTADKIDWRFALGQSDLVTGMVQSVSYAPELETGVSIKNGFGTVTGRAKFLRHGELFPDQPAPGTVILSFQGLNRYYASVDAMGMFYIRGVADKQHVLDKLIIEGYRFDAVSGAVVWAIDKKETGKEAYRLKMQRRSMETNLVIFACRQITMFKLLEPRSFQYLTKIQLIDGRREAAPQRYWYSRIDTRSSTIASIFLEPGSRLKVTLSDTVLTNKVILTNGTPRRPEGTGYPVGNRPFLNYTEYRVAKDMWTLLGPRIANLEKHGIVNERIQNLKKEAMVSLYNAEGALAAKKYDRFSEESLKSWALASRVYDHVEKTQKDVLFGVLFYIALFVPFSFCLERLIFCFSDIYKRILAFCGILASLIAVIYQVHPAFQLAYSPMVVILAFFIIGLSLMVALIIFSRFEEEMVSLQDRARHLKVGEISRWKAFLAAFFFGGEQFAPSSPPDCLDLYDIDYTDLYHHEFYSRQEHASPRPPVISKPILLPWLSVKKYQLARLAAGSVQHSGQCF